MKSLLLVFKSCFVYVAWLIICLIFTLLSLPFACLPEAYRFDNRWYFKINVMWSWLLIKVAGIRYQVEGYQNIPLANNPSIIVMNHTSMLDIPLLAMHLQGQPHVWISNDYSKIPLFGFLLRRMYLLVKRGRIANGRSVVDQAYQRVAGHGRHIVMFPEGTRRDDGNLHHFYSGFAVLADRLQRPVVPVIVYGLHKICPKGRFVIDSSACCVRLKIGHPMTKEIDESKDEFIARVHSYMSRELAHMRA